jgi:Zn-dependent hydrolases, including glyoxylases
LIGLKHNDTVSIGNDFMVALFTPGHYKDSMCYWVEDEEMVFTGDTVFVGRTGRTISGGSDISDLYNSVYKIILELPLNTVIYPGHHYGLSKTITIQDNIALSQFFTCKTLDEFILTMKNFEDNR